MLRLVILSIAIFSSTILVVLADPSNRLSNQNGAAFQTTNKKGGNPLKDGVTSKPNPQMAKTLQDGFSISIPGTPPVGKGVKLGVPSPPPVTGGIAIGIPGTPPVGSGIANPAPRTVKPSLGGGGITKRDGQGGNPPPSGKTNLIPQTGKTQPAGKPNPRSGSPPVGFGTANPTSPSATQPVGTSNGTPPTANTPLELAVGPAEEYVGKPMARQFVIGHNKIRAKFNLQPLKWNRTLARFARHWAYERMSDCKVLHSTNNLYGENLFWSLKSHWTPRDVVSVWSKEHKYYNPNTNECINNNICGHYTQMVWHTTTSIGCGRVECLDDKGFLYVCSYEPPGNFYFEGPFGGKFDKSIVPPQG